MITYIGTTGEGPGKGISIASFDIHTGVLSQPKLDVEDVFPEFFLIHPSGKFLYVTNASSQFQGNPTGGITVYAVDKSTGHLTKLNSRSSGGPVPCYLNFDSEGKHVVVSNYQGGSVICYAINSDGSLGKQTAFIQHEGTGIIPDRQDKPYAHSIQIDPGNRFALAADLGTDKMMVYRFASDGSMTPHSPPFASLKPGSGPRHFTFSGDARFVYVLNELGNTITVFAWDGDKGNLTELQMIGTLPQGFAEATKTAEIRIHPTGRFLYATNRGHNSIAVYSIDSKTGLLSLIEIVDAHGNFPRYFEFDPTGRWLVVTCRFSDSISVFAIDQETGKLTLHGEPLKTPAPFCIRFLR